MLTFPNVTPQVFALVLDQLRTEATVTEVVSGYFNIDSGDIKAHTSSPLKGELDVYIDKKPWWMPEAVIESKIRDAITLAQQAIAKAGQGGGDRAA